MKTHWDGENLNEIALLFNEFDVHVEQNGDTVRITGPDDFEAKLQVGDAIDLGGGGAGFKITRASDPAVEDPYITWTGNNMFDIVQFIEGWLAITPSVIDNLLVLEWIEERGHVFTVEAMSQKMQCFLERGDRLVQRGMQLIVSRAGTDHRN